LYFIQKLGHIPVCVYRYTAVLVGNHYKCGPIDADQYQFVYLVASLSQDGEQTEWFEGAFKEMDDVIDRFKGIDRNIFLNHSRMLFANLGAGVAQVCSRSYFLTFK